MALGHRESDKKRDEVIKEGETKFRTPKESRKKNKKYIMQYLLKPCVLTIKLTKLHCILNQEITYSFY